MKDINKDFEYLDEEDQVEVNEKKGFGIYPAGLLTILILIVLTGLTSYFAYRINSNRNKEELIDKMTVIETNTDQVSEEMIAELNDIMDYLTGVEETISTNETLLDEYSKTSESGYTKLNGTYKESTQKLGNDFNQVNSQIKTTKENIETLIRQLENKGNTNQGELVKQYDTIKESITQIDSVFSKSHDEINKLIKELSSKEDSNSKDLASKLKTMESGLTQIENDNMTAIKGALSDMEDNYENLLNDLKGIMNEDFDELDQTINNNFESLSLSFTQGNDSTREELDKINKNLELVFQYVSDGKELVASAITDKGVDSLKDAKFVTLACNIASIGTEVIDVNGEYILEGTRVYDGTTNSYVDGTMPKREYQEDYIPDGIDQRTYESGYYPNSWTVDTSNAYNRGYTDGKADVPNARISYIYHEHKLDDGTVESAGYTCDHADGCFNQPVYNYHHHSGSSSYGGGCYTVRHEEQVDEHCGGSATTDWGVGYGEYWYCNKCGARMDGNYGQCEQVVGHHTEVYYTLGCGKGEGSIESVNHYKLGCGKTDYETAGENATISSATIVYED